MRDLSIFEKTTTFSSEFIPVNVVTALALENAPPPEILKQALQVLQNRHPLLRVAVRKQSNTYNFQAAKSLVFEFNIIDQYTNNDWLNKIEDELGRTIDFDTAPLFFINYFHSVTTQQESVFIATFHHSIMDATGAINFLDELLKICEQLIQQKTIPKILKKELPIPTPPEDIYPPAIQGSKLFLRLAPFIGRQMRDELKYQWVMRNKPKHKVHHSAKNKILRLDFSITQTTGLSQLARKNLITLNELINATMLYIIWQTQLSGTDIFLRTFSFADLRAYLIPPASEKNTAPHIAMMRFTIKTDVGDTPFSLAKKLNAKNSISFKRNEKFLFNFVSDKVMQLALKMKNTRMASTALSYSGTIPIDAIYGKIKVKALYGYISTPPFGPILAAEAGILNQKLFIDFIYQDLDISLETATKLVKSIQAELLALLDY